MGAAIPFAVTTGLLVGTVLWAAGVPTGYSLAVRSAHRSSLRRNHRVFRGLASPWDVRVAKLKAFPLWVVSVAMSTLVTLLALSLLPVLSPLLLPVLLAAVLGGNILAGFQKGIAPAEKLFFKLHGMLGTPQSQQTENFSTWTTTSVESKELTEGQFDPFD